MKKSKPVVSPELAQKQQEAQTGQLQQAQQTYGQAQQAYNPYLPGSTGMSDFRRNLTNALTSRVSQGGEQQQSQMLEAAQRAGFGGGAQPLTFAAGQQLGQQTRQNLANIPAQVEQQAAPLELQAAGGTANIGRGETDIGQVYNPLGYYQTAAQQEAADRAASAALWGGLAGGVGNIFGGFLGRRRST